jgi:hypothetical protein
MSALRSLLRAKRTWLGEPCLVVIDPQRTSRLKESQPARENFAAISWLVIAARLVAERAHRCASHDSPIHSNRFELAEGKPTFPKPRRFRWRDYAGTHPFVALARAV